MCTGFVKLGSNPIYGYNLDIDPSIWNYKLIMNEDIFTIAITVGKTTYYTHGVNKYGKFSNLPYMNDYEQVKLNSSNKKERIDILTDRYLKNKYNYNKVIDILNTKTIYNAPLCSMHTLLTDGTQILLIEPGYGYKEITSDFFSISNYPLLKEVSDYSPYYGIERKKIVDDALSSVTDSLSALDAINLLLKAGQDGPFSTKVTFVYSKTENCVYYVLNKDITTLKKHCFSK